MKDKLQFNIDAPQLLEEITNNNAIGILKIPLNVLRIKFIKLADLAIKLDNPELNILMLEMKLYDVKHNEIQGHIKKQRERINKNLTNP